MKAVKPTIPPKKEPMRFNAKNQELFGLQIKLMQKVALLFRESI